MTGQRWTTIRTNGITPPAGVVSAVTLFDRDDSPFSFIDLTEVQSASLS
jgi:hypothetical protein